MLLKLLMGVKCWTTNIVGGEVVHLTVLRLTKTRHVGMSNEVTSLEIYASIKHLM